MGISLRKYFLAFAALAVLATGPTLAQSGGFLRDAQGAIVATISTIGASFSGGFLRAPSGALVIDCSPACGSSGTVESTNQSIAVATPSPGVFNLSLGLSCTGGAVCTTPSPGVFAIFAPTPRPTSTPVSVTCSGEAVCTTPAPGVFNVFAPTPPPQTPVACPTAGANITITGTTMPACSIASTASAGTTTALTLSSTPTTIDGQPFYPSTQTFNFTALSQLRITCVFQRPTATDNGILISADGVHAYHLGLQSDGNMVTYFFNGTSDSVIGSASGTAGWTNTGSGRGVQGTWQIVIGTGVSPAIYTWGTTNDQITASSHTTPGFDNNLNVLSGTFRIYATASDAFSSIGNCTLEVL